MLWPFEYLLVRFLFCFRIIIYIVYDKSSINIISTMFVQSKIEFHVEQIPSDLKKAVDLGKFVNIYFNWKENPCFWFSIKSWLLILNFYQKYNTMIVSGSQNLRLPFQNHLLLVDLDHTLESRLITGFYLPPQVINVYVLRYGKLPAFQGT